VKVGLIIIDEDPGVALTVAKAADVAGVHSIWTIDYYNRSSLTRAAAFAAATSSVMVGTSVTPLFARSSLALAAAAQDIQLLSEGRFVLGVGSSTRRMNKDWHGFELDHPAPRVEERIRLVRELMSHRSGPFRYEGRFESLTLAHFDHETRPAERVPILAAGVGARMTQAAGHVADGFVGHTVASAENLAQLAEPVLSSALASVERARADFTVASQVIASVGADRAVARERAALQVGFYCTPKGYDALFPDKDDEASRRRARDAFVAGDIAGVGSAGLGLVEDRAVFGTKDEVYRQLARYQDVLDLALLYPPYFSVDPAEITRNEFELIDIAARWNVLTRDVRRPGAERESL
jgi:alkanesulfonate monooxygenase SsuD/methylene tetrahydromethanopterin reductase-like flavin-dependent oxidoreductase (luciferase family)